MEDRAHGQRGGDRQGRIIWLAPGRDARFRPPRRDRIVREPDGQATAPSQCRVVFRPVRDAIARLRNVMAMLGVVFERHGGFPDNEWDYLATTVPRQPVAATGPCNTVPSGTIFGTPMDALPA